MIMVINMRSSRKKKKSIIKTLTIFIIVFIFLVAGIFLYSRYLATTGLEIREYKIQNDLFTKNFHGFKILHMSDIHYLTTVGEDDLKNIVKKINQLKPDVVVLTGDLLDEYIEYSNQELEVLETELSKIDVATNKYAISGDEDEKKTEWETVIKNSNFINLNNTYDLIYNGVGSPIMLSGLSSNLKEKDMITTKIKAIEEQIDNTLPTVDQNGNKLYGINNPIYQILLLHEPDYIDEFNYHKFQLILAGHSLNGQIRLPGIGGILRKKGATNYQDASYDLEETKLFISGGIGTTNNIPYRFCNRPSVNLYRLTK